MPLDQDILKLRWGIEDDSLDPLVDQVAATAQALAESYCGRMFDFGDDAEDFPGVAQSCQLRRYPIKSITGLFQWQSGSVPGPMTEGTPIAPYGMDPAKGLLWPGGTPGGILHVVYEGGYETWPADLAWAVTQAADILWADTPGGGAPAGSTGGSGLGAIKKLSVVGVYSAELSTDSGAAGEGGEAWGVLPMEVTAVLDRYRVAAAIGIG